MQIRSIRGFNGDGGILGRFNRGEDKILETRRLPALRTNFIYCVDSVRESKFDR